jgi:hypothetical protein
MVEKLKEMKNEYGVVGLKAEFEAEGTRNEELFRLKEICYYADISLTVKIGGCEGFRDLYNIRSIGIDHILCPMVETEYALSKYLNMVKTVFPQDERNDIDFLINIETIQAVKNFDKMLATPEIAMLDGIVIGRSDLTGSMGLDDKSTVDSDQVFEVTQSVLSKAKKYKMDCVVGGSITASSLPFINKLGPDLLDRFETRKVCFDLKKASVTNIPEGINKSIYFELLWLQNKRNYYKLISEEDSKRIKNLEARFR